jgi:hypothetical protein
MRGVLSRTWSGQLTPGAAPIQAKAHSLRRVTAAARLTSDDSRARPEHGATKHYFSGKREPAMSGERNDRDGKAS